MEGKNNFPQVFKKKLFKINDPEYIKLIAYYKTK